MIISKDQVLKRRNRLVEKTIKTTILDWKRMHNKPRINCPSLSIKIKIFPLFLKNRKLLKVKIRNQDLPRKWWYKYSYRLKSQSIRKLPQSRHKMSLMKQEISQMYLLKNKIKILLMKKSPQDIKLELKLRVIICSMKMIWMLMLLPLHQEINLNLNVILVRSKRRRKFMKSKRDSKVL